MPAALQGPSEALPPVPPYHLDASLIISLAPVAVLTGASPAPVAALAATSPSLTRAYPR